MLLVAKNHGIKDVQDLALSLGYKSPEKLYRLDRVNEKTGKPNNPSFDLLVDLANKFENMDVRWLVTGKASNPSSTLLVAEPEEKYLEKLTSLHNENKELQIKNAALLEAFDRLGAGRNSSERYVGQ